MIIMLILLIAVFVTVVLVGLRIYGFSVRAKGEKEVDYLIILGARVYGRKPGKHLKLRLDTAIDMLRKNPDIITIASGGRGTDEEYEEAEVMREYILENISDRVTILAEGNSYSTYENLMLSKELIRDENARIGIVTNGYHLFRAIWYAKKLGIKKAIPIYSPSIKEYLPRYLMREIAIIVMDHLYFPNKRKAGQ